MVSMKTAGCEGRSTEEAAVNPSPPELVVLLRLTDNRANIWASEGCNNPPPTHTHPLWGGGVPAPPQGPEIKCRISTRMSLCNSLSRVSGRQAGALLQLSLFGGRHQSEAGCHGDGERARDGIRSRSTWIIGAIGLHQNQPDPHTSAV